jgi:hypothetical protein
MSKINLKNIIIEGYSNSDMSDLKTDYACDENLIYQGKTSEIPEELAKECVENHPNLYYRDYNVSSYVKINDWTSNWIMFTAKESI